MNMDDELRGLTTAGEEASNQGQESDQYREINSNNPQNPNSSLSEKRYDDLEIFTQTEQPDELSEKVKISNTGVRDTPQWLLLGLIGAALYSVT